MVYNLVIDADSILYTCCYRHQVVVEEKMYEDFFGTQKQNGYTYCKLEYAYMDFVSSISRMKSAIWSKFELNKEDSIEFEIVFSPKKTFRNDLSPTYKANRKPSTIVGIGELKKLVTNRLGSTEIENLEADDIVITRAYEKENVIIGCIDKDIYTHSPVPCINYNKWEWTDAVDKETIEEEYYYQAITGDSTDGIKGVVGIGKVGARALVSNALEPMTYEKYVSLFDTEEEAILSMRLVRMDMYKNGELVLWDGM